MIFSYSIYAPAKELNNQHSNVRCPIFNPYSKSGSWRMMACPISGLFIRLSALASIWRIRSRVLQNLIPRLSQSEVTG
jgi:TRAP-type C4-dicarboxylate transport system permease small subunit